MSDFWTESFADASQLELERDNADQREWEAEQLWDRLRRDDPCAPMEKAA